MRNTSFGRRRLLAAAGWVAAGTLAACSSPRTPPPPPPPEAPDTEQVFLEENLPTVTNGVVFSQYRGTSVQLFTAVPTGVQDTRNLPMVMYLHGRDGVHPTPIPEDTLAALERGHREGTVPPFGFVVPDAGYNPYYYDGSLNGDLMSMLMEEVPQWLVERGFEHDGGVPVAAAGISTGGFGALRYTIERNRAGAPPSALGLLAPAVPTSWEEMQAKNAFASEEEWRENDPLQHKDELGEVPIGAWIGESDAFMEGLTEVMEHHENTPVFTVLPGGHEPAVFDVVGQDMVQFLGNWVPRTQ